MSAHLLFLWSLPMRRLLPCLCAALFLPSAAVSQDAPATPKVYTQAPEHLTGARPAAPAKPRAATSEPKWIWGADANKTYFVKTKFAGGSKEARLIATCDNVMTLWLNGEKVAASTEWEVPTKVDVQKHVKDGENELLAEIGNQGGPSGFALTLTLVDADGKTRHVVSDESWKVAESRDAAEWVAAKVVHKYGEGPWGSVLTNDAPGSRAAFNVLPGFQVERLFTVPKDELGSWVSVTTDNQGRLIVSDEGKHGLCRITPPPIGSDEPTKVEPLGLKITSAQGLLYAHDSLYLSINGGPGSGLYRARDTDGDDQFDDMQKLRDIAGGGEHGPHGLRLSPDGQSIYIVCGNHTRLPKDFTSRIPPNWDEDLLLPRQWDANGHAVGILAPGGWIARTDPEGKTWEVVSMGYRNAYDMAFNADGELFAYDSDMEWNMGTPWYRPTRLTHGVSGSEFGWRSGTGHWPAYYADSLPPVLDIGPGSPVGVTFGYGAKFPAKYQKALYLLDWTFGTIYAIHLEPDGATYKGVKEEFVSRTPLPLTDAVVGADGALYFTIGGRGTQSELFRVTYSGDEPTEAIDARDSRNAELREIRHTLEAHHAKAEDPAAVIALAWPYLDHPDRFIRYAARIAIENQPVETWQQKALAETRPTAFIHGLIALARQGDEVLQLPILARLATFDADSLPEALRIDLLRAIQLICIRLGRPEPAIAAQMAERLEPHFPHATNPAGNRELVNLLVYLESPKVLEKTIPLLQQPSTVAQSDMAELLARNPGYGGSIREMLAHQPDLQKLHYVFALRNVKTGWTLAQRKAYFDAIAELRTKKGGASYPGFLRNIDREAFENATEAERLAIEASGARPPYKAPELPKLSGEPKAWTLEEVVALQPRMTGRSFENGQKIYAATRCIVCHRFNGEGGATGPDLTQAAGRFAYKDLAEAILDPSKVVSDQFRGSIVQTTAGVTHTGKLLDNSEKGVTLLTDPEDPTKQVTIPKAEIEAIQPSQTSLMPKDLLQLAKEDDILDLMAYILSRGNKGDGVFAKK